MTHSKFRRMLAVLLTFVLAFSLLSNLTPNAKAATWTGGSIGATTFSTSDTITVNGTVTITGVIVIQNPGTVVTITGGGTLVRGFDTPTTPAPGADPSIHLPI